METIEFKDIGASITLTETETGFTDVLLKSEITGKFILEQKATIEKLKSESVCHHDKCRLNKIEIYEKALEEIRDSSLDNGWKIGPYVTYVYDISSQALQNK